MFIPNVEQVALSDIWKRLQSPAAKSNSFQIESFDLIVCDQKKNQ